MAAILKITKIFMGTPSKTILNQLRYLHAKFGTFVQRVTIFSLSHLTTDSTLKKPYINVTHIWRLQTPACVLSDFLRQFWRKRGFMTPELGQITSSRVEVLSVKFACIFHEVQLTILVF